MGRKISRAAYLHELCKSFGALNGHGVVHRGPHAAHRAVPLQLDLQMQHHLCTSFLPLCGALMHIERHSAWHCLAITSERSSIVIECTPKSVSLPPAPSRALCKAYHVLLARLLQELLLQGCIGRDGERDVHVGPHRGLHRAAVETIRGFNGVIDLQSTGLSI